MINLVFASIQIFIYCHFSLQGESLSYIEQSIGQGEQEREELQLSLAEKTRLDSLEYFAKKNNFQESEESLDFSSQAPIAYKNQLSN